MALSTTVDVAVANHGKQLVSQVAIQSDWVSLVTAPETAETGDAVETSKVVRPGAITRSDQRILKINSRGTNLLVMLKYNADGTPNADPVLRIFGRDKNGQWHLLQTTASTPSVEATITTAVATDVQNDAGTYKFTTPVEVDLQGSLEVMVTVQTAFNVSGGTKTDSELLVKVV